VDAILAAGIRRVVAATTDPNPKHSGRGFGLLRAAGVRVASGVGESESLDLNASFNHWIVHRSPWVILKAAMTLDGKIATETGESRWITGPRARGLGMRLRHKADGVLVGVDTLLADDPELTVRDVPGFKTPRRAHVRTNRFRIVLDTHARTPITSRIVADDPNRQTLIVVGRSAPRRRIAALEKRVKILRAPERRGRVDLRWLMDELGSREVISLLVEGGGEVHASFLEERLAHEIRFFYAPMVLGGKHAKRAVAGAGFNSLGSLPRVINPHWSQVGDDLLLKGQLSYP
jgi:diaminohydroxyphosphoribosylaminopyrimidine deaminase/5-amino-6-(5-phosphoribosylamino)uracil reductase